MEIISIITTKNRPNFLEKALYSIKNQKRCPNIIILVTDSNEKNIEREKNIIKNFDLIYLPNEFNKNYAGSLNTAIHYLLNCKYNKSINEKINKLNLDFENTYIAILDDDDEWNYDYLYELESKMNGEDFGITGLIYKNEEGEKELSIPNELSIHDFLRTNPHIQGSNTFVKLKTLLKAGLFDENMNSTTDRDIFTRILMLNPTYKVINKYLVNINAEMNRSRITNNEKKIDGLKKFYYKYNGFMTKEDEEFFFQRCFNLFNIEKDKIIYKEERFNDTNEITLNNSKSFNLIIGFIATEFELGLRLLENIKKLDISNIKVIVIENSKNDFQEYQKIINDSDINLILISHEQIKKDLENFNIFIIGKEYFTSPIIKDIAIARSILHEYLYINSKDKDVIWVLDEDMELFELKRKNNELVKEKLDIKSIICEYMDKCDAIIGGYSNDAPLPILSTIRCSLIDFMYSKKGKLKGKPLLNNYCDYYYDLSDYNNSQLETPFQISSTNIDDVFSNKTIKRQLFISERKIVEANNRGGNTLIFNRELLKFPNCSISVKNKIGRRSDYFWVLQANLKNFKIISGLFHTYHNKSITKFDFKKEEDKFIKDLIGYSFTKTIKKFGLNAEKEEFYNFYKNIFYKRLVKYICSYYRIIGLLNILENKKYLKIFNEINLEHFIFKVCEYVEFFSVSSSYESLKNEINNLTHLFDKNKYKNLLISITNDELNLLGFGSEGIVFKDKNYVYKCFYSPIENKEILYKINEVSIFGLPKFEIKNINNIDILKYKYEEFKQYKNGYYYQFSCFIHDLKKYGYVYTNFKKENFIIVNDNIQLIDIGKSIEKYDEKKYKTHLIRCFEMLRFPFLSKNDFKELINRNYSGLTSILDSGYENFEKMCKKRFKEELHDDQIIKLINKHNPKTILDYGAGKCKIANSLDEKYNFTVYDINTELLKSRASKKINVIFNLENLEIKFDMIICNLVLCCVDNIISEQIMKNISSLLKINKHTILSICNPFYNTIKETELRKSGLENIYKYSKKFIKNTRIGIPQREEFHRPIEYYINLFFKNGFEIINVYEGDGINTNNMLSIGEHLIFELIKKRNSFELIDCSLLIKTNPMEYKYIYDNIKHIVIQLEKGIIFKSKIVIIDAINIERVRRYSNDNLIKLKNEIYRAKINGLIDEILVCENISESIDINKLYFNISEQASHSKNGQGTFATLYAFEKCKTNIIFQTDSDMIYHNENPEQFIQCYNLCKNKPFVTISIPKKINNNIIKSNRIEVRSSFINLKLIKDKLPYKNSIENSLYEQTWHRIFDKKFEEKEKLRLESQKLYYLHPENHIKNPNDIEIYRNYIEKDLIPKEQIEKVNIIPDLKKWLIPINSEIIIYIRGRNTTCEKIKRMFDSLKKQDYQNFQILYIDDASENEGADYAKFIMDYDSFLSKKSHYIFNKERKGELSNLCFSMRNIIINKNTIIINLDNDDYFIDQNAISIIKNEFDNGADLTCGNCIRYDKPLKKYIIQSFKNIELREGDNIWLHPKCFKRYLFDYVSDELLKNQNGEYFDVNTDLSFMVPMVKKAKKPVFIDKIIYYFEPSLNNQRKKGLYEKKRKNKIKKFILQLNLKK